MTDAVVKSSHFFPAIKERYDNFTYDNLTTLSYTDAIVDFNPVLIHSKIKSDYILFKVKAFRIFDVCNNIIVEDFFI